MSRLTRDGTAEPVSRDQILRHARGQGNIHFPCLALTTSRIGDLTRLIHTLLHVMTIHTYIKCACWKYRCDPLIFVPLCDHERDWHSIGLWLNCCVTVVSSGARTIRWMCESTTRSVDPPFWALPRSPINHVLKKKDEKVLKKGFRWLSPT